MLKKLLAFFEAIFVVILVILVIAIFTFRISFSGENSLPTIFGHSFFILDTDEMQNEGGTGINKGSLVVASESEIADLKEGMVVLCDINTVENAEADYDVLRIYSIEPNNEMTTYTVSNEKMASNRTYIIGKDKIVAKCKYSSDLLGQIIAFSQTSQGILTLVIIPCVVLIALQIVHIVARARRNRFERVELETFEFPSDMTFPDDEQSPLYDPAKADFAQKTDVEEFFANKTQASSKDSKHKSKKQTDNSDSVKPSEKKKKSQLQEKTDMENKTEDIKEKKHKKSDDSVTEDKKDKNIAAVDVKPEKTEKAEKSDKHIVAENTDNSDKKDYSEAETTASESKLESDEKLDNAKQKTEAAVAVAGVENIAMESEATEAAVDEIVDKAENTEALQLSEDNAIANNDDEKATAVQNNSTVSATSENTEAEKHVEEKPKAAPVKKKTAVKKRATVKKGPSASAADLLKAIDTESKKLK